MLAADELVELRELQARAYGRDGTLSGTDAARLRELERRRQAQASPPRDPGSEPSNPQPKSPAGRGSESSASFGGEATAAERTASDLMLTEDASTASLPRAVRPSRRVSWLPVTAVIVLIVALGVGLGWLLFGRGGAASLKLTAEQQQWQNEIVADGRYDSGSLRAVGEAGGVVVWIATKDGEERTCLVMSAGERPVPFCSRVEEAQDQGLHGNYTIDRNDIRIEVVAQVLFTGEGEPAVRIDQHALDAWSVTMTYATEEETRIAANLSELGYEPNSIWVAGYDGDVPIWTATRVETQEMCLIYDGSTPDPLTACQEPSDLVPGGESITLSIVDPATGAVTEIDYAASGPQYLVITRNGGAA